MNIITIAYNEEIMIPYFIAHYRKNFPGCVIIVYDNESTDNTVEIAKAHDCKVISYQTNGKLSDQTYINIKNNHWKELNDWVIIADIDEFCDITQSNIEEEESKGVTIIKFEGYNMVNLNDDMNIEGINAGVRSKHYDKSYCFDARKVDEINYIMGAHGSNPQGEIVYSESAYRCRHFKYINIDYMIQRHALFASRLSEENLKKDWGTHYLYSSEEIRNEFLNARKNARNLE